MSKKDDKKVEVTYSIDPDSTSGSWATASEQFTVSYATDGLTPSGACVGTVDTMKASTIPIKTVGLGLIASCGFLLFIAGTKGRRILTPNTSILSHQYSWGSAGKEHELYARVKEFELSTKRMIQHYKKCIGMNEKQIREVLLPPQDVWLDAKEAYKLKICDKIEELY